jgi:glucose/arabinose dehydrogenase
MKHLYWLALVALLCACGGPSTDVAQYGSTPQLPAPQKQLLPTMKIANPALWGERKPIVPQGYDITAIATDLLIPRQTLLLPNGDILVAEGRGGHARKLTPKDVIAAYIKAKGTSPVKGGDRLTLLRDADGDGVYEVKSVFASDLDAPYGMALIGSQLYVANQGAVVRFDYEVGQTQASALPVKLTVLPSAINHHWT